MTYRVALMGDQERASALALFQALDYDPSVDARWFDRFTVGDPTCSPDLRLVALEDELVAGFVVGCVRAETLVCKFVATHPAKRQQGVATALLQALEAAGRARGLPRALAGGVGPNFFYPGIDLTLTPALSFFWKHGYETDRVAQVDMRVDLARAPLEVTADLARLTAQGLAIRRVAPAELAAVAAFGGSHADPWRQEVLQAGETEPITAFAAFDGAEPVSFAVYGVTGPHRFGPTLSRPDYRQRGIGGVLLKLCLTDIQARGWSQAEISWAGPVHYYARTVGAVVHKAYWIFTKQL